MVFHLQVNANGVVSFRSPFTSLFPFPFPTLSVPLVAPFWDAIDVFDFGDINIFYRQTSAPSQLQLAANIIQDRFPGAPANFRPDYLIVATWCSVTGRFQQNTAVCV